MWLHIENLCDQNELPGDNYIVHKDIGGVFLEPLWDRMLQFGIILKHVQKSIKYIKGESKVTRRMSCSVLHLKFITSFMNLIILKTPLW